MRFALRRSRAGQFRELWVALTTRHIIEQLDSLTVIETQAVDGSCYYRLTPLTPEQADLIATLRHVLPAEIVPALLSDATPSAPKAEGPCRIPLLWEVGG